MGKYYGEEDVMRAMPPHTDMSDADKEMIYEIKTTANRFEKLILSAGANRELSLAKTKLEEAVMWAVKGITS